MSSKTTVNKRWGLWLVLLAVGAWLALFGDKSPAGGAALSLPAKPQPAPAPARPVQPAERPRDAGDEAGLALVPREQLFAKADDNAAAGKPAARDLFSIRSWNPPPPPPPPPAPAPPPVAPPLPYTFLGKKLEGDVWEVFLAKGEQTFIARASQVLENDWRVDSIAPPTLTVTYLPLGLPQTLSIGDPR